MEQAREAAQAVSEFFQGNPFGTAVGQMIEQATDASLASENWALIMEICDLINSTEEGPRDAVRAIRKRLQTSIGKSNQTTMYTLTVLETCVKNCDHRLHQLVTQKEFVQELVKIIGPKYDPPQVVQEKVLSLIQTWAHAFRDIPDLRGVQEVYDDLKSKGVEFPVLDPNAAAPIFIQQQHPSFVPRQQQQPPPSAGAIPQMHPILAGAVTTPTMVAPNAEQLAKLRSELDTVSTNLKVLRELLTELAPGQEDADDLQLLRDLNATNRQMQRRILELLECVSNEEVTSELLLINDELNNVFAKYDRYTANRSKDPSQQRAPGAKEASGAGGELIDLGAAEGGNERAGRLSATSVSGGGTVGGGQQQQQQSGGSAAAPAAAVKENEYKEMESWLKQQQGTGEGGGAAGQAKDFEKFLTERADASTTSPPAGAGGQQNQNQQQQQQ